MARIEASGAGSVGHLRVEGERPRIKLLTEWVVVGI